MALCSKCEVRLAWRQGLCCECVKAAAVPRCLHCKVRAAVKQKRGLCMACYCDKAVRVLYPKRRGPWDKDEDDATANMTDAELDALIAEQMKPENLPPWWDYEVRKQQKRHQTEAGTECGQTLNKMVRDARKGK